MTCKHSQQIVRKDEGTMIQKCLSCGELRGKWVIRTGRFLYEPETEKKTEIDH